MERAALRPERGNKEPKRVAEPAAVAMGLPASLRLEGDVTERPQLTGGRLELLSRAPPAGTGVEALTQWDG